MKLPHVVRICPRCQSRDVQRSHRRSAVDYILYALGAEIRRCHECGFRHATFNTRSVPLKRLRQTSAQPVDEV
jgi:hypothetical protein